MIKIVFGFPLFLITSHLSGICVYMITSKYELKMSKVNLIHLQKYLKGLDSPAKKQTISKH